MSSTYAPRRPARRTITTVRGLGCHLTHWGGRDGDPLVLLHGFMDCGETFQFLVDAMPEGRRFVAPDWRGFGRSGWSAAGYWFPDYFADLEALLDDLGLTSPVTLVGHSMGGNVAMMYAGLRPERVGAVVNLEGFGLPRTRPQQAPERYREWLRQLRDPPANPVYPSSEALAALLRRRNPRLTAQRAAFIAHAWTEPCDGGGVRLRYDPAHKRVNPVLYRREEAEECWRSIEAPVLLVLGGESGHLQRLAEEGLPEALSRIVPTLEVRRIEGATHMLHHEQPEALAQAVEAFLQGLPGA
ncbi:MAG TPA: alpha/beta hydrolase [Steroidobacteraceae bacterium]|nr:alpha/beta hydrolase [Steroidobacteraceae bacterium]